MGPVRLRTIHTQKEPCSLATAFTECYIGTMGLDDVVTDEIDGIKFQTCEELGAFHSVIGE